MKVKWVKDPRLENGLKRLGIHQWEIVTVKLEDIDSDLSQDRQARIGKKINEDNVIQFAQLMEGGAAFFMPLLNEMKGKRGARFFIWSGNHRVESVKLVGDGTLDAYVIKINDQRMMDILPRVVNTWEGERESKEAVLEHCRYIVGKHGLDAREVASMFGVTYESLNRALRMADVDKKIEESGIKSNFPPSTLILLSPLTNNLNVLRETCRLMKEHDIKGQDMRLFLDDVKKGTTELQRMAQIGNWEKLMLSRKKQKTAPKAVEPFRTGKRDRMLKLLTSFAKFLQGIETPTQLQLDDADVNNVLVAWNTVEKKMNKLIKGDK